MNTEKSHQGKTSVFIVSLWSISPDARGLWSAVTCHRFPEATCRRRTAKGVCGQEGRSRLAPAPARPHDRKRTELRRRLVACAKAVTSHRTPNDGRGHELLHPALPAGRRPFERGAFPPAPSLSAFLPISAVFHSAPLRSERSLNTPQRSEGTQRGKARMRVPHTHCGGGQSFSSTLAAPRAPQQLRLPSSVFITSLWSIPVRPCHLV